MTRLKQLINDQKGMASIVVTVTIITVVSLTVFGFATIMRREARQATDQQLSSQAFYAAEAAINEKTAQLLNDPLSVPSNDTCQPGPSFGSDPEFATSTCVTINKAPTVLEYDEVATDQSLIVMVTPDSGQQVSQLTISWDKVSDDGTSACSTNAIANLPRSLAAETVGMLRLDMTRMGASISRTALINQTFSAVLHPRSGTSNQTVSLNPAITLSDRSQSPAIFGGCDPSAGGLKASAVIQFTSPLNDSLLLRLRGVYKPSSVQITGTSGGASTGALRFVGAQAVIDSTAKVSDVVRRIRAHVPLQSDLGSVPDFSLRSTDEICKLMSSNPQTTSLGTCPL